MKKFIILFSFVFLLFGFNNVYALSENITQINFTSIEQSINVNTNSDILSIQTQNSLGEKEEISESGTKLNITSSSPTGEFSSNSTDWVSTNILGMNKGWANRNFYYRDSTPGVYIITVSAEGKTWASATQEITIEDSSIIPDIILPVITLIGDQNINLKVGDVYIDSGVTASDDIDGDITSSVIKGGTFVDTLTAGIYTITYDVKDSAGNSAIQIVRNINISEKSSIPSENILIRNGENIIYNGTVLLPEEGTIDIQGYKVDARSILGILYNLDEKDNNFSLSNLIYYKSFESFYLKCITTTSEFCDNWQYVVGSVTPTSSIDKTILKGGESIGLFFGNPHQITFDKTSINKNESITANTQKYNYLDDSWIPLLGVTVGVTTVNPIDEWIPIVVSENPVDENGKIIINFKEIGNYNLGIKEDYYFPTYPIVVKEISSGGGSSIIHNKIDIDKALAYLSSKQNSDGSFGSDLYTDWAGIAFSNTNLSAKNKIINYFKNNSLDSDILTDNERHAMALMSLGINPYSGTEINYIKKIVDSFDGEQFGDKDLVNDDIFAIFPLMKAGYSEYDKMIQDDISFILSKQEDNGSFGSVDMTSAFIQAIENLDNIDGLSIAKEKAEEFLENSQKEDGGFENSFSTSWVILAINSLGGDVSNWEKDNLNPNDYLFSLQQEDGGLESLDKDENSRIWATSYAIPAASGVSWFDLMESFSKPIISSSSSSTPDEEKVLEKIEIIPEVKLVEELKKIEPSEIIIKPEIIKEDIIEESKDEDTLEENTENNLSASVGDAFSSDISTSDIFSKIGNLFLKIFEYIGRGFYWIFSLVF